MTAVTIVLVVLIVVYAIYAIKEEVRSLRELDAERQRLHEERVRKRNLEKKA